LHDYTETLNYILKMNSKKIITFKHSGHAGDLIYSLASVKYLCEKENALANFYININAKTDIKGHPSGNVMIPQGMYDFLYPLIVNQKYINNVEVYRNQGIDYDLDLFRTQQPPINLSAGNIATWYSLVYHELTPDLSNPWLSVDPLVTSKVVLARTERYLNPLTHPQGYVKGLFVGTDREWAIIDQTPHELERKKLSTALEMAQLIAGAKYVVSNQTLFFAIAEGLKARRVLEQYWYAPNVIPQGGEWYIYNTNDQLKNILLYLQHGRN